MAEYWRSEYEALFDVEGMTELEARVWAVTKSDIRVGKMGYRTKTIKSGDVLEVEVYPAFGPKERRKAEEQLKRVSAEKMARHNYAKALRHIIRLMNTNFTRRDLHVTLTYAGLAPGRQQAKRDMVNFLNRVKRRWHRQGIRQALKYIYVIEDQEEGVDKRTHIHLVMSGGLDRDEIEKLWGKGYCNADRLQPNDEGLAGIARYFVKNKRAGLEKSERAWTCSKNLEKPKTRVSDTKLSNRRVQALAYDFNAVAKEIMEKLYKGYRYVETAEPPVKFSDLMSGCFIRVQMIRMPSPAPALRCARSGAVLSQGERQGAAVSLKRVTP